MLVAVALLVMIMVMVVMLMLVAVALLVVIMVMVVSANGTFFLMKKLFKLVRKCILFLKCCHQLFHFQLCCRSCNDSCTLIMSLDERKSLAHFRFGGLIGMAEENTTCVFYLVVKELTKVLHIHLTLIDVNHNHCHVYGCIMNIRTKNRTCYVTELSNT